MSEYKLKPLTKAEQLYAYKQSQQIAGQTGYYGYLHGDFDKSDTFNNVFEYYGGAVVREHFDEERNSVIDFLEDDIYSSLRKMRDYCYSHKEATIKGNFGEEYGFRIDAGNQTLIIRFNPFPEGDYNCYIFAYDKHLLDRHIKKASKGINFIHSDYTPMFNLEDGDNIMIKYSDGETKTQECRFIDEYHTQIGNNIYHICQYAELIEKNGTTIIPMRKSLPEKVYHYTNDSKTIEVIAKGADKTYEIKAPYTDNQKNKDYTDSLNNELGVTKRQVAAMVVGSILGWDVNGSDPRYYDNEGMFIRNPRSNDNYER